jgi:hypothetical protein
MPRKAFESTPALRLSFRLSHWRAHVYIICSIKQCVLAGSSGTHSLCICTTPSDMKLMFTASKIYQLTAGTDSLPKTEQDCVTQLQYNPPTVDCCLGESKLCGKEEELRSRNETLYDENYMDEIAFKWWTYTDRTTWKLL